MTILLWWHFTSWPCLNFPLFGIPEVPMAASPKGVSHGFSLRHFLEKPRLTVTWVHFGRNTGASSSVVPSRPGFPQLVEFCPTLQMSWFTGHIRHAPLLFWFCFAEDGAESCLWRIVHSKLGRAGDKRIEIVPPLNSHSQPIHAAN